MKSVTFDAITAGDLCVVDTQPSAGCEGLNLEIGRVLFNYEGETGEARSRVLTFRSDSTGRIEPVSSIAWLDAMSAEAQSKVAEIPLPDENIKEAFAQALEAYIIDWQPDRTKRARAKIDLIGVHAA